MTREDLIWARFILRVSMDGLGRDVVLSDGRLQKNLMGSVEAHRKHYLDAVKDADIAFDPRGVAQLRCVRCNEVRDVDSWYCDVELGKSYCPACQCPHEMGETLVLIKIRQKTTA